MDKNAIKKYAIWARRELIARVSQRALYYGISEKDIGNPDAESVNGRLLSGTERKQRSILIIRMKNKGYEQVIEEVAYTWFNRFAALRFMEVNGYLPSHVRVFTNDEGQFKPQILTEAINLELDGLDMAKVYELKQSNKDEELYKYLLITQCNALSSILPGMFQRIEDYTELLLPDYLLREGSVIEQMIAMIPERSFNVESEDGQIEIIGWLYQYYISEKHDEVVDPLHGKIIKKEEVPAATQLFTTDWVVRYIIDNSVGRYWVERNPHSLLADNLTYFIKPKNGQIKFIDEKIVPQDVTTFDPCVGSGHFLIYAFDVLMKIYVECGYSERDAAAEIVSNNLFGLDIDGRASQLAYFSVMMKARQYDRRFFFRGIQPHIFEIKESNSIDKTSLDCFCNENSVLEKEVKHLLDSFIDAKEYGSLLRMPTVDLKIINDRLTMLAGEPSLFGSYLQGDFRELIHVAEILNNKYAIVATNPPYLNKYDSKLKVFLNTNYNDYSGDLFSVFIYRNFEFCLHGGYSGLMTPFVWMFIKAHDSIRTFVLSNKSITTLVQMEYSAYEEATVPICTFVCCNAISKEQGVYIKLSEFKGGMTIQGEKVRQAANNKDCQYLYAINQQKFFNIPGAPLAYWGSKQLFDAFTTFGKVQQYFYVRNGITTGDNNAFLRLWFEVSQPSSRWFPCNKGGSFRKWSGNRDYVVDWEDDGYRLKTNLDQNGKVRAALRGIDFNFTAGITMSRITSGTPSFREMINDSISESATNAIYPKSGLRADSLGLLALLNSAVGAYILDLLNPTINVVPEDLRSIPVEMDVLRSVASISEENCQMSVGDWDSFETSWDFKRHPLLKWRNIPDEERWVASQDTSYIQSPVEHAYTMWMLECDERFNQLKANEEELNRIFIDIYGLQDELNPEVEDKDVTVRKADLGREIRSLISYAVGCMFGRYSLDVEGLAYAGGEWDESKYSTFIPDADNVLPITDDEYFTDDIVTRFVMFIEVVYGKETLEENLRFISSALGGKGSPREVIRNYFLNDFYADHLKIYQKRPIYWLFDSGKKNGFKALIYMHRYQPDTIARIRTDYVHEQQSRYRTAIADLENRIAAASTSERVKLTKQLAKLQDQAEELLIYEEKIHHLADQMIRIELDDGVKVNYAKFQDVLAKIK